MIQAKNISKIYNIKHKPFNALSQVSLEIKEGQKVVIMGKSGSGKSTLMHILALLDTATSGSLFFDGEDVSKMKMRRKAGIRSQMFGFVFQQFYLQPNLSVYDNVVLPLKIGGLPRYRRKDLVMEALFNVDIMEKAESKAVNISGGEKQRVAIARAIVNKPRIVFADEPTGNLDSSTSELIENLLLKLNSEHGITLVTVTHDHDIAKKFDIKIKLVDGKIQA